MPLQEKLDRLETVGLISLAHDPADFAYLFRHALIQDAAYSSLLKADRRILHHAVGETLATLFPDAPELAPLLAEHFERGGDPVRARHYFQRAAAHAAAQYANAEARLLYTRALALAPLPTLSSTDLRALILGLGRVLELTSETTLALAHYEALSAEATARADRALLLDALLARAALHATANQSHDAVRARTLLAEASTLAHALGDQHSECRILWTLLLQCAFSGNLSEALSYGERALALARTLDNPEQLAFILHDLWMPYMAFDDYAPALRVLAEAVTLWTQLDSPMLAETYQRIAYIHWIKGDDAAFAQCSEVGLAVARACHNLHGEVLNRSFSGVLEFWRGALEAGLDNMRTTVALAEACSAVVMLFGGRAELSLLLAEVGAFEEAYATAEAGMAAAQRMETFQVIQWWPRVQHARIHLRAGDTSAAAALLAAMPTPLDLRSQVGFAPQLWMAAALAQIELARAQNRPADALALCITMLAHGARTGGHGYDAPLLLEKGRAEFALGHEAAAWTSLQAAHAAASARALTMFLWPIAYTCAALAARRNDPAAAHAYTAAADEIIATLTATLADDVMRAHLQARAALLRAAPL